MAGTLVSHTIAPPPHPEPGSAGDAILMRDLQARMDDEFKVKVLRGKVGAAPAKLRGDEGFWREIVSSGGGDEHDYDESRRVDARDEQRQPHQTEN